jgi:hypothetical protein
MFSRPAAGARDPFGEPGAGSGEVAVPVEGAVSGGGNAVGGQPAGAEGGEFFQECTVFGPAGRDGAVVEAVSVDEPRDPRLVVERLFFLRVGE